MPRSLSYYIFSWFFLIFTLLLGVRFLYTKLNNAALKENFSPHKRYTQYLEGTPIEEIDFELLHQRFHYASGLVHWYNEVIPEKDIYYYAEPDRNSEVVFTLYAGEKYYLYAPVECQRTESWPTYTKGWRYARPLFTEDEYSYLSGPGAQTGLLEKPPYGYIRLSDLRALVFKSVYDSPDLDICTSVWERIGWHFADRPAPGLFIFDEIFWKQGVYLSPDLYLPYWRLTEKILAVLIALCGGGVLAQKRHFIPWRQASIHKAESPIKQ